MTSYLELTMEYNAWANQRLLDFCAGLNPDLMERRAPENLRTIREAFAHVLAAEQRYLSRFGRQLDNPVMESSNPTLEQLREIAGPLAAHWRELTTTDVDLEHEYRDRAGSRQLGIVLVQAAHHGSDHRSQVCTTLGALGIEPPEIDVWAFGIVTDRVKPAPEPPAPG